MTTADDSFAKKISTYLDGGAAEIKAGTAYRLQLARQEALARLADPERVAGMQLVGAHAGGSSGPSLGGRIRTGTRLWLGLALIVATGFGYQQWQAYQQLGEIEETDAAILSSDLPIDAYLDRGFQNWLKRASDD